MSITNKEMYNPCMWWAAQITLSPNLPSGHSLEEVRSKFSSQCILQRYSTLYIFLSSRRHLALDEITTKVCLQYRPIIHTSTSMASTDTFLFISPQICYFQWNKHYWISAHVFSGYCSFFRRCPTLCLSENVLQLSIWNFVHTCPIDPWLKRSIHFWAVTLFSRSQRTPMSNSVSKA